VSRQGDPEASRAPAGARQRLGDGGVPPSILSRLEMPDSERPPGPSLEQLADEAGVDYWAVRKWLEREVARRQQERYRMHGHAIARLDARLDRLVEVPNEQAPKSG
jgi:hypothetical protein